MPGKRKYNSEKERKEARKKFQKKYFNSEKGKLAIAKMSKSGARKKAQKKYFNSKKGKEAIKRANKSEAKKKAQKKYISTEKGKTKFQKGVKRYKKTDKGKKAQKSQFKDMIILKKANKQEVIIINLITTLKLIRDIVFQTNLKLP